MKIYPVGAKLCYAERGMDRQDTMKITVTFRNFVNAPKNVTSLFSVSRHSRENSTIKGLVAK
jgi:hypothetical protein